MDFLNQTISRYKLTRLIGTGGMASVYEGVHVSLGTKVAVKIMNPNFMMYEQLRHRFDSEAKFMAMLEHQNIIRVLDIEEKNGIKSIIMDLLEGKDLEQYIHEKISISGDEVKMIFNQILSAFFYAHSKGIIHRDIKPSNIFVDKHNQVKIMDFGIARKFGTGSHNTQTGDQLGTPLFMSPEQVKGDNSIDHRTDIYSLGCTLYFVLTGKNPFVSNYEIYTKIVNEPLPLIGNHQYDRIIQKATAKDRNLRYQNILEFKEDLFMIAGYSNFNLSGQKSGFILDYDSPINVKSSDNFKINHLEIFNHDFDALDWENALKTCNNIGSGWRIPTCQELSVLYFNKENINGLSSIYYWSSDEIDAYTAIEVNLTNGKSGQTDKNAKFSIRPVRTI